MSREQGAESKEQGGERVNAPPQKPHAPCSMPAAPCPSRPAPRALRSAPGFSLAEILFAMAITSFALLALVGTLPHGLENLRMAEQRAAEARIVSYLTTRHQLLPWAEIEQGANQQTDYFDARGAPVRQGDANAIFTARSEIEDALPLPGEVAGSEYMRRLRIRIINQTHNLNALSNKHQHRERVTTLVNMDRLPSTAAAPTNPETGAGGTTAP
jgi:uncharacterized protein (TIGR02598 family)